jgi:polyisoprenoid-binding protein YceI
MDACRVLTFREGLLSPVGHDLILRVQRFSVEVATDGASLEARFDAGSLMVEAPASLSAHDRASIEETIRREVLEVRRHPEIRFRAKVSRDGDRAQLDGTLTLKGVERPLRIASERVGEMWRARVTLHQQDFGIKPHTAMLGALRVRADVIVEIEVRA